ncbi:MAG: hypothetical protein FIA96_04535 [Betaproteobacteria bacterium]|jgi:hypothetical protein|nr:hypothetical protein [Betaproteobacteria bacterium]
MTASAQLSIRSMTEPRPSLRDEDPGPWAEEVIELPAFPVDANLIEIAVSAVTANRFFVDGASIRPGQDGVVRYTLVVRTAGGATNVSFEGIRCKTGEYRLYASGRADGSWAPARLTDWRRIENKAANRQHAALNREFFCPVGSPIATADEGRDALRRGKHPLAP